MNQPMTYDALAAENMRLTRVARFLSLCLSAALMAAIGAALAAEALWAVVMVPA